MAWATAAVILVLLPASSGWAQVAATQVERWGRFETTIRNEKSYANPFADVELNATFTSPAGRQVRFIGFYDGDGQGGQTGNVWKLRFMPDEAGRWSYECAFSDGTPGGKGVFHCVAEGGRPGPLRIAGRHFRFADGRSFYPRSYYFSEAFTAEAPHWRQGIETFFGGQYRYNFCCATFWQGPGLAQRKWNKLPFNGFYPLDGKDYTRLSLKGWRHVDEVLGELDKRNVVWFNFDGFVPNVGGTMGAQRTDFKAQQVYARNAVARLAPHWNVTWNIAFEWWEFMKPEEVKRLADYVRSLDPWRHPLTVHDQGKFAGGREVLDKLGVDFVTLQYSAGTAGDAVKANQFVLKYAGDWPVYAQEVCWEGKGKLDGEQIRKGNWGVALGGAFGNHAEQFGQEYGQGKGLPFVEVLLDLMQSLPLDQMAPHNELVNAGVLCLAKPGGPYVCYTQAGGSTALDLSGTTGEFAAEWFDPRTGAKKAIEGKLAGGGKRSFVSPDEQDWALIVRPVGDAQAR